MLTKEEATSRAKSYLESLVAGTPTAARIELWDEKTREVAQGWLFFWQSDEFLRTHDPMKALIGGGPLLVDREDGSFHLLRPVRIEQQLREYSVGRKASRGTGSA